MLQIDPTNISSQAIGRMGELVVELELIARGWIVGNFNSSTSNAPGWDLFAAQEGRSLKIRVKAKRPKTDCFRWSTKADGRVLLGLEQDAKDDIVAAVSFTEVGAYDIYLIPAASVEADLRQNHLDYLSTPKVDGSPKKDSNQRNIFMNNRTDLPGHGYAIKWECYKNDWNSIEAT